LKVPFVFFVTDVNPDIPGVGKVAKPSDKTKLLLLRQKLGSMEQAGISIWVF
jgi:hypothetical protein